MICPLTSNWKIPIDVASSAATGGLANPALSFVEDALAVVTLILAVLVPLVVVAFVGLTLFFATRWLRRGWRH